MNTMRHILKESFDFKLSDMSMIDKMEYSRLINEKKTKTN
jgi:hypothetical protein